MMGARWTRKYKPIEVLDIIDAGTMTKFEIENKENDLTLAYMKTYGMQNVRGGYMTYPGLLILKTYTPGTWQSTLSAIIKFVIIAILISAAIYFTINQF
jgi:hypothetical protein